MESPIITATGLRHQFRETVAHLGEVADDASAGVLIEDTSRRVLGCNRRFCELLNIEATVEALVGADSLELARTISHSFSDPQAFLRRIDGIVTSVQIVSSEVLHLVDGRTFERDYLPVYLGSELAGHLWQYRDVTEAVEALRKLWESEARFAALVDAAPRSIIVASLEDGTIRAANRGLTELLGFEAEEVLGRTSRELGISIDSEARERALGPVRQGNTTRSFCAPVRTKSGEIREVELAVAPMEWEGEACYITAALDVTEQRRASEALRQSEERFRLLAENAHDIIFRYRVADPSGMEYISPAVTRIAGYLPEQYYEDPDFPSKVVHPDDRPLFDRMAQNHSPGPVELRWLRRDGSVLWAEQTNALVTDDDGELIAIEGVIRDITPRRQAEEALQRSRDELEGKVETQMAVANTYGLSFREFTVLHLVAAGLPDRAIAEKLAISPLTVHKHVANILAKMNASSRTEAGVRAFREGLLD